MTKYDYHTQTSMNENNAQVILDAGMAMGQPSNVETPAPQDGTPYTVIPHNYKLQDLAYLLPHPPRKKAVVTMADLSSFARYLKEHGTGETALFCNRSNTSFSVLAVLDYHEPKAGGRANWREHLAYLKPTSSRQWLYWTARNKQWQSQEAFAEMLQDHTEDVVEPNGATLLEVAKELIAKKSYDYRSALNLKNGTVQFQYVENMETSAGAKGNIEVPEKFKLAIPLDEEGPLYDVGARLRHKIEERRLVFRYELLRAEELVKHAQDELLAALKEATTQEVFMGSC